MSPSFLGTHVNKRSMTLNVRTIEAIKIIKKLLLTADVVYCSVSGYGQEGPWLVQPPTTALFKRNRE
ncbi:MAG: hypothetical protein EVA68_07645 [OM182 bacterium]|uniref:Uncharacterized protein n=1 Tax=OM182 bacterium TaxID=2510334 RepID=A0A520RYA1_9GAMM|nr:MAG: hypothetical protein CBC93_01975 [Gammaproteobacteria bacterium TMED133]RZO75178.1 MAG: hypothetical protein EVA68_07645 [OM182 bacterium]